MSFSSVYSRHSIRMTLCFEDKVICAKFMTFNHNSTHLKSGNALLRQSIAYSRMITLSSKYGTLKKKLFVNSLYHTQDYIPHYISTH